MQQKSTKFEIRSAFDSSLRPIFVHIRVKIFYADNPSELCRNDSIIFDYYQKVIIFAMRKKTKERREAEKELLYYLEIYSELRGREGVKEVLAYYDMLIQEMVERIKGL